MIPFKSDHENLKWSDGHNKTSLTQQSKPRAPSVYGTGARLVFISGAGRSGISNWLKKPASDDSQKKFVKDIMDMVIDKISDKAEKK